MLVFNSRDELIIHAIKARPRVLDSLPSSGCPNRARASSVRCSALGQKLLGPGRAHEISGHHAALKASRVDGRARDCALDGFGVDGATFHVLHLLKVVRSVQGTADWAISGWTRGRGDH